MEPLLFCLKDRASLAGFAARHSESGASLEEFLIGFPPITRDQAIKVLELARTGLFDSCREVKILIDHNLDWRISDQLSGHEVRTALEMAWDTLKNALLTEAEKVRVLRINHLRQGIKDQQTMKGR